MTVTLELTPEEAAALEGRARAEGASVEAVLHRLIARLTPPPIREPSARQAGGADDPEERAEHDREREEMRANMDRWRAEQGRPPA